MEQFLNTLATDASALSRCIMPRGTVPNAVSSQLSNGFTMKDCVIIRVDTFTTLCTLPRHINDVHVRYALASSAIANTTDLEKHMPKTEEERKKAKLFTGIAVMSFATLTVNSAAQP
jgi:hypothetical protein